MMVTGLLQSLFLVRSAHQRMIVLTSIDEIAGQSAGATWQDTQELTRDSVPLLQNMLSKLTARLASVPLDHCAQRFKLIRVIDATQICQFGIATCGEQVFGIQHVRDTGRHTSSEVLPGLAKHNDHATSHIFAAMIANALDDRQRTAVTNG